jgi:hypothetical protein
VKAGRTATPQHSGLAQMKFQFPCKRVLLGISNLVFWVAIAMRSNPFRTISTYQKSSTPPCEAKASTTGQIEVHARFPISCLGRLAIVMFSANTGAPPLAFKTVGSEEKAWQINYCASVLRWLRYGSWAFAMTYGCCVHLSGRGSQGGACWKSHVGQETHTV